MDLAVLLLIRVGQIPGALAWATTIALQQPGLSALAGWWLLWIVIVNGGVLLYDGDLDLL